MVKPIKEMGFGVSLDDFGTSYSSIVMLTQMGYDFIKLDRSFIHGLIYNQRNHVVTKHIINT